jgi:hypothetical protein
MKSESSSKVQPAQRLSCSIMKLVPSFYYGMDIKTPGVGRK